MRAERNFARYAWAVTSYNLLVILWGAWVRITGSGAGCGSHWPTCQGEVIPRAPGTKTLIELAHRTTSGLSVILTAVLIWWALRVFARGHLARRFAGLSAAFLLVEALVGAGLVLFGLTANDSSVARAVVICVHLVNTFALLGAGALTAHFAQNPARRRPAGWPALLIAFGVVLVTSMSGAITALGDTLFPVDPARGALWQRLQSDMGAGEHFLVRLRVVHPIIAVLGAACVIFAAQWFKGHYLTAPGVRRASAGVTALVLAQVLLGGLNIALRAPGALQIAHLFMANAVWLGLILLAAQAMSADAPGLSALPRSGATEPRSI